MKLLASLLIAVILAATVPVTLAASPINFRLAEEGDYLCKDGTIYTSRGNVLGGRLSVREFYRRLACAIGK